MAYEPIEPYIPQPTPKLPGNDRQFLEREFVRLELVIQALIAAIEELRAKVP